jgi:hypothetical protein
VGKGAKIPSGIKIGRNCKIGCWMDRADFDSDTIPSGASLSRKVPKRYGI